LRNRFPEKFQSKNKGNYHEYWLDCCTGALFSRILWRCQANKANFIALAVAAMGCLGHGFASFGNDAENQSFPQKPKTNLKGKCDEMGT